MRNDRMKAKDFNDLMNEHPCGINNHRAGVSEIVEIVDRFAVLNNEEEPQFLQL